MQNIEPLFSWRVVDQRRCFGQIVDNLGHEVHQAAKEALRTGETMPCYVDPDQPSLSVFSREFSIPLFLVSMLFPVFFGGASVMLVVSLFLRYRQTRRRTKK